MSASMNSQGGSTHSNNSSALVHATLEHQISIDKIQVQLAGIGGPISIAAKGAVDPHQELGVAADHHQYSSGSMQMRRQQQVQDELGAEAGRQSRRARFIIMTGIEVLGRDFTFWGLMMCSSVALVVGLSSATLLGRLYFVHGGSRRWLYTWVESAGWPIMLPAILLCHWRGAGHRGAAANNNNNNNNNNHNHNESNIGNDGIFISSEVEVEVEVEMIAGVKQCVDVLQRRQEEAAAEAQRRGCWRRPLMVKLGVMYVALGCLTAFDNLLYSWGLSYLPVSTNSLVCSSQLAFNALFAYALVGQRITPYAVNAMVVITSGTVLLGAGAGADRPPGTTQRQYALGFVVTVAASALYALMLALIELIYRRVLAGRPSFVVVLEVQVGISAAASAFSLVGMWASGDLAAVRMEARAFDLGIASYCLTLAWSAVGWQLYILGGYGIIFLASSLMSCVFMTAMIPVLPVLAVIFNHDSFSALKGIAMLLSIWGFISYIYGAYLASKDCSPSHHIQDSNKDSQSLMH